MRSSDNSWCILQTSPSQTPILAGSLGEAGFDVWTPKVMVTRRIGRSRFRRDAVLALAPGFVFARYGHVRDLVMLSRSPALTYRVWDSEKRRMVNKGHPHFTVFRYLDAYPWVADRELDALRLAEQRGRPKAKVEPLEVGSNVKHPDRGFEGMVGTVQGHRGRFVIVLFEGFALPVHIEPRQLVAC